MGDILMKVCRETGEHLAPPSDYPTIPPGALADQEAKIKLVSDTEKQITDDINAIIGMDIPNVIARVRADDRLNAAAGTCLPGLPLNVAAGMSMRFYAGFLDMAKTLRETERQEEGLPDIVITPEQRTKYMNIIHARAQNDEFYAAGVSFGWWGIERPGRTEKICDDGISGDYKNFYLADYDRQKQQAASAMPPATDNS